MSSASLVSGASRRAAGLLRWTGAVRTAPRVAAMSTKENLVSPQTPTHTGQAFDPKHPHNARFIDRSKEINPRFAKNLVNEVPPIEVDSRIVSCDGGNGALGHPKVYINLDKGVPKACGYCGLRFVKKAHH